MTIWAPAERTETKWKRYPEYKESGVQWLGQVPADWSLVKLKYCAPVINEKLDEKPEELPYLGLEHIESGTGKYQLDNSIMGVDSVVTTFKAGDVLFGKLRPYLAKVVCADFDGVGTSELLVLRPNERTSSRYIFYQMLSSGFIDTINAQTYGVKMPRANADQVGGQTICLPPMEEQRAIARFLDRETARIDALIDKKERLIELLEEKRTAVISHAVTKGLDPAAPMKDSGIPPIGQIPAHWEVERNKHIFHERDERSSSGEEELLTVSHITGVTPRSEKEVTMFMAESLEGYKLCFPGDLVINTMWAWMGALGFSKHEGIVSPSYNIYRLRSEKNVLPDYLDLLYRTPAYVCEITRFSKGVWTSRLRLYPDEFFNMQTVVPPLDEQRRITEFVADELQAITNFTDKLQTSIDKLKEFRTALISAAVTGKIDVREAS